MFSNFTRYCKILYPIVWIFVLTVPFYPLHTEQLVSDKSISNEKSDSK